MISLFRTGLASGFFAFAMSFFAPSTAQADDRSHLLVGQWEQGAERVVGEDGQKVRVSNGTEDVRADGTSSTTLQLEMIGSDIPEDLRVYHVALESEWRLEGDAYYTTPIEADVTYAGENPMGLNIAKAIKAGFMEPVEPMIIVSLSEDNYVARGTDGTLISMTRK